jgi:hypothetical protein
MHLVPDGEHSPDNTTPSSTPSIVSAMPNGGSVSMLAQLEALTVIKHHMLNIFLLNYLDLHAIVVLISKAQHAFT